MCRRLEDCLVSRTGFRIFIISVLIIFVAALGLNFGYKLLLPISSVNYNEALQASHHSDHHILLWTPLHGSWEAWWKEGMLGGTSRTRTEGCPQLARCSFSADRSRLNTSHLVLYSYMDLDPSDTPPKYAGAGQRWGLFLAFPPSRRHSGPAWNLLLPMFDLLISYSPQSSIQMYRGRTVHLSSLEGGPSALNHQNISNEDSQYELKFRKLFRQMLSSEEEERSGRKRRDEGRGQTRRHQRHMSGAGRRRRAFHHDSRLVATLIDDCHTESNREGYIEEMSEHLNIHIYGACGAPCPGSSTEQCLQYLSKFYKFVLVFEPYMCQHFVSDLIWAVLSTDMVPVVFGGVSYSKLLPRGSYIDALNQSPKNLAHFLRYLDRSDELYSSYLLWKDSYRVETQSWLCELCSSLDPNPGQIALPQPQVSLEPPQDRCTAWPDLKFGLHHNGGAGGPAH